MGVCSIKRREIFNLNIYFWFMYEFDAKFLRRQECVKLIIRATRKKFRNVFANYCEKRKEKFRVTKKFRVTEKTRDANFRLIRFLGWFDSIVRGFFFVSRFFSRLTFFLVALQKPNGSEKALVEELKQLECSRLDVDSRTAANHHRYGDDGSVVITRILPVEKKKISDKQFSYLPLR